MAAVLDRYKKRIDANPALARFCGQAGALVSEKDPETFWRLEPAFRDLLASDFLQTFVLSELGSIAEDGFYFIMGSEIHTPVVESAGYMLMLKLMPPEAAAISPFASLTEHLMLGVWRDAVEVQTFTVQEPFRHDVFDRNARLVHQETIRLVPGMVARFRSPNQILRLRLERITLLVQLQSVNIAPLRWIFHPETLEPVRAVAARLSSSRLQFTCQTLAALGSPASIPALKRLMTHPEHFVRWAAVQSICAISRQDGIECLQKALEDNHPHIRNAAEKTLANLQQEGTPWH